MGAIGPFKGAFGSFPRCPGRRAGRALAASSLEYAPLGETDCKSGGEFLDARRDTPLGSWASLNSIDPRGLKPVPFTISKPIHCSGLGSVLIWSKGNVVKWPRVQIVVLALYFILRGSYARRFHSFQPPVHKAAEYVREGLNVFSIHAVQKCYMSCDNEYLSPSVQLSDIDYTVPRERKNALLFALPGGKREVEIDLEIPYQVNVRNELELNSLDGNQVIRVVQNPESKCDLARIFEPARNVYTEWNNGDPLAQSRRLERNLLRSGFSSLTGFPSLPTNYDSSPQRYYHQRKVYPHRSLIVEVLLWGINDLYLGVNIILIYAAFDCGFAFLWRNPHDWRGGLLIAVFPLSLIRTAIGAEYDQQRPEYHPRFQHDSAIVPHKYLGSCRFQIRTPHPA